MSFGEYQFRMPKDTPTLNYKNLIEWLNGKTERNIGKTVTVINAHPNLQELAFRMYDKVLCYITPNLVHFTDDSNDPHMATGYWLNKIATDNGIGDYVVRRNFIRYLVKYSPESYEPQPIAGNVFKVA